MENIFCVLVYLQIQFYANRSQKIGQCPMSSDYSYSGFSAVLGRYYEKTTSDCYLIVRKSPGEDEISGLFDKKTERKEEINR